MIFRFKNTSADLCGQGLSNRRKDKFSLQYRRYFFAFFRRARSAIFQHFFSAPSPVARVSRSSLALHLLSLA